MPQNCWCGCTLFDETELNCHMKQIIQNELVVCNKSIVAGLVTVFFMLLTAHLNKHNLLNLLTLLNFVLLGFIALLGFMWRGGVSLSIHILYENL